MIYNAAVPSGTIAGQPDSFRVEGHTLILVRDKHEVQRISLKPYATPLAAGSVFRFGPQDNLTHFLYEVRMAGISDAITDVTKDQNGAVTFTFLNGDGPSYGSIEAALAAVQYIDNQPQFIRDLLILKAIQNSPDGTNLAAAIGSQASANRGAAQPIVYTEAT